MWNCGEGRTSKAVAHLGFNLRNNPFRLLKADYSSSASEINEFVEDVEFDGHPDVEQLHRAQQVLVTPRNRLLAELSWLPELSASQITRALDLLDASDVSSALDSIDHFPELAKANIAAHLLAADTQTERAIRLLNGVWEDVDSHALTTFIDEKRAEAGFPSVEGNQIREALEALRQDHAKAAASSIWRAESPGKLMNAIVEAELDKNPSGGFLNALVREYDAHSEGDLARIVLAMDEHIKAASEAGDRLDDHVQALSDLLVSWDEVNQPVQVYEQHRGHEEGRSKQIYEKIRSLCLDLANNHGRYAEALRLAAALLHTFPELESVAQSLKKDVSDLEQLVDREEIHRHVEPLVTACERAKNDPLGLRRALIRDGFSARGTGPLAEIARAFQHAQSATGDASVAYAIIRDLALFLNNEKNDPETAFRLLNAVLRADRGGAPSDTLKQLSDERAVVHKNWKMKELEAHSGNPSAMSRIVGEMLQYATGSDKAQIAQLKSKIDSKRNAKKVNWGIIAAIAGIIGFVVIADELDRPSSSPAFQPSTPTSPTDRSSRSSNPTTPTTRDNPSISYREDKPAVGSGRLLSKNEVRYCIFQSERLDYMRQLINSTHEVESFNKLVQNYNPRCSDFRYRPGVLRSIEDEATTRASQLRADARRTVAGWGPSAAQPTKPKASVNAVPEFLRYPNTDFFGGDLTQNGHRGVSIDECEEICARSDQCKGYTYVHEKSWCWPKSGAAQRRSGRTGLTSANKTK